MKKTHGILWIIFGILAIVGCTEVRKVTDVITNPTAREVYERQFKDNDSLFALWNSAFEKAQRDSLIITLPYAESGVFSGTDFNVYTYNLQLREGEQIIVETSTQPDSVLVFIELFEKYSDSSLTSKSIQASEPNTKELRYTIEKYGSYKITVQPEMYRQVPFQLKIYTQPTYTFPVSGATNKNVQSFWAASRDGGRRSHEGIDIFAPRGTPLLAITDGRVSSTGDRGLGGKQVWLRDGLFGKTLYYAHLDSINVVTGQRVALGDTLGFVGNSGNAKTTEPHLHFGIYKGRTGPVDPYPYVKITEIPEISEQNDVSQASPTQNNTSIHQGPSEAFEELSSIAKKDTIAILGRYGSWFHVKAKDSVKGFMKASLLTPLPSN